MMETASETSQSTIPEPKKRSQADKRGRIKYTLDLLHDIIDRLDRIQTTQRFIVTGLQLAEYMRFDEPYIDKICARDELDKVILEQLWQAGHRGILPRDIVNNVRDPKLWDRWQVLHRIEHMNRRLDEEIGQRVAEKRGHEWAITDFTYQAFKLSREEMKDELENESDQPQTESTEAF